MMRIITLIYMTFITLNVFSQNDYFKIKEGSFTHVVGAVMDDAKDHTDVDDKPMALFKISTENINDEERHKLYFTGNRVTEISDKVYKTGSVWIYITAEHSDFLEIRHPDYGITRFYFPESLCDFCTYEMVLQYNNIQNSNLYNNFLTIITEPDNADIYIDGEYVGKSPKSISSIKNDKHELKLLKQGYMSISKEIILDTDETVIINEKLEPVEEVIITTEQKSDKIYVDNVLVGISPVTIELTYGSHDVKAERNGKIISKIIYISQDSGDEVFKLMFGDNQTFAVKGVFFDMVFVKGGTFKMGCNDRDADESEFPVHDVTLNDYYIGETEITQKLWKAVMGYNPSENVGDNYPVENVTWIECNDFINELNRLTGMNFRLPTEAEWEYAPKGGAASEKFKYSGSNRIREVACYYNNSKHNSCSVKSKLPNELGIYDMSGNVWEWCYDRYDMYKREAQINPLGASVGIYRVNRGGCFYSGAIYCRNTNRNYNPQDTRNDYIGFRLALSL